MCVRIMNIYNKNYAHHAHVHNHDNGSIVTNESSVEYAMIVQSTLYTVKPLI